MYLQPLRIPSSRRQLEGEWAPIKSKRGKRAVIFSKAFRISEEEVMCAKTVTTLPAWIQIPLWVVAEVIPARISVDKNFIPIREIFIASIDSRLRRLSICLFGDNIGNRGYVKAVWCPIDGTHMPTIVHFWRQSGERFFQKLDSECVVGSVRSRNRSSGQRAGVF